jgi:hypothetical protein
LAPDTDHTFRTFTVTTTGTTIYGDSRAFIYTNPASVSKDKLALISSKFTSNNESNYVYVVIKGAQTPSEAGIC